MPCHALIFVVGVFGGILDCVGCFGLRVGGTRD